MSFSQKNPKLLKQGDRGRTGRELLWDSLQKTYSRSYTSNKKINCIYIYRYKCTISPHTSITNNHAYMDSFLVL